MEISLHPIEKEILKALTIGKKEAEEIAKKLNKPLVSVLRGAGWLKEKGLVDLEEEKKVIVKLTDKGRIYLEKPLPEKRLFDLLKEKKEIILSDLKVIYGFDDDEISVAIGELKKRGVLGIKTTEAGPILYLINENAIFTEEKIIDMLRRLGVVKKEDLNDEELLALGKLKKRGLIEEDLQIKYYISLTPKGLEVKNTLPEEEEIEIITRDVIIRREWEKKRVRPYNLSIPVKPSSYGKKHPYLKYLEYVRKLLIGMGFEEMEGPIVLPSFWNNDALFMPQDHPSREVHDIFFVKSPKYGEISDKELYEKVKREHLEKWKIWKDEYAKRMVLRSQVTALSALTLRKVKIPGKYFAIEPVFRPDTIDAKHFIQFNQLEGFVADENITFRELLGILKEIAYKLTGAEKVKFFPAYFPFTEPSVEGALKHPELGWIECLAAGMFREEVLKPYGIEVPVIAWGLGIDRMAMIALGINDIRDLFSRDLKFILENSINYII